MRIVLVLFSFLQIFAMAEELDIRIPVVDMQDFYRAEKREEFLRTLFDAMHEVGFFAVRQTGIDRDLIKSAYKQAESFFKKDLDYKMQSFDLKSKGQRGFVPGEVAKGANAKDYKEFFHIGREDGAVTNVWPDQLGFQEILGTLYQELSYYVIPLQEAIIEAINQKTSNKLPKSLLNETTTEGDSLLRALYYPPVSDIKDIRYWAAPHTDIDYLAILPCATEKGLQVELNGQWLNVIVPDDAFIVNVGDMLENLTNGLFVSARHRVVALDPCKERFSMVLFVHPADNTPLDPLPACIDLTGGKQLYAPGTRNEFLWERLLELNVAPGLLEPYSKTGHAERQMQYGRESKKVVELLITNNLASDELLNAYNH